MPDDQENLIVSGFNAVSRLTESNLSIASIGVYIVI